MFLIFLLSTSCWSNIKNVHDGELFTGKCPAELLMMSITNICRSVRAYFHIFLTFLFTFATLQNLPMTNITFDGVRVLGAESEQKASYHTCTGKY